METRTAGLMVALLAGCDATGAALHLRVASDFVPGVEVTALRVEVAEDELFDGRVEAQTTPLSAEDDLADGVEGAVLAVDPPGARYVRASLLDAAGRVRAQRIAVVDVVGVRALTLALERGCAARLCPGDDDPDDALACFAGSCVPETCTGEDAAACAGAAICASDADCYADAPCREAVCRGGACLAVDACGAGEVCDGTACRAAPRCGDGVCDASVETACGCPGDCGACPAGCGDGVCDSSETRCPDDCGAPEPECGNGLCEVEAESDVSCPEDCAAEATAASCGDARCEGGERCEDCPECCEARGCGDGACDEGESACGCPADCGPCAWCGDARCDDGEDCPEDCGGGAAICGDGVCAADETCALCERDCGWCAGTPTTRADATCVGSADEATEVCGGLNGAYTRASVNVGYYPMRVAAEDGTLLVTGDLDDGARGRVIRTLEVDARFAAQSTRNPGCSEAPPLRPSRDGWIFGYAIGASDPALAFGWVAAADLELDDASGEECAYGPEDEAFAIRVDPYGRPDACRPLPCEADDFFRGCRDANPPTEGDGDCGVARDEVRAVAEATLGLHFAPGGPPRTHLHEGDRVRVLHESGRAGWVFVESSTSGAPRTAPVGSRGWVREAGLR